MAQDALDYFLHGLGILFRMRRIYPPGSKQVYQSARHAHLKLAEWGRSVRIAFLGNDAIVEDRRIDPVPFSFQALFQSLQELGLESVQIDADADEGNLTGWIEHVISKNRTPYQGSKIVTGSLSLEKRASPQSVLTRAVTGYLGFLAETQGILSDLESRKPEGIVRAREVVCEIVARLAIDREVFQPIRELKDFDEYTFTHALNVCVLSSALARALRVSDEMVNTIAMAGLCHDLGKMEVPREVLNYKGPLAPKDRGLMEKHSLFGAQILLEIPGVDSTYPLLPVVAYQHHMGANQSGYPRVQERMQKYSLHFISHLVAVADVYDALRTVRPYRPAMSVAKSATILIRDALAGKLHKEYVSFFLLLLNVLAAGRRVVLSDGSRGMIVETHTGSPLSPMVGDETGRVRDLSGPSSPTIWEVEEDGASDLQEMPAKGQSSIEEEHNITLAS
jgi:HD-GYP domain-containing protein (c-di-GMP phosphodiesterase class II)